VYGGKREHHSELSTETIKRIPNPVISAECRLVLRATNLKNKYMSIIKYILISTINNLSISSKTPYYAAISSASLDIVLISA